MDTSEVRQVKAMLTPDRIVLGYYRIEGGTLVMVHSDGTPAGKEHVLRPDDDPNALARVFTKEIRLQSLGISAEQDAFRNRPIEYRNSGVV